MSSSLGFSTFSDMENKDAPKKKRERIKNKTIKKRSSKKVEQFLNSMNKKESFGVRVGSDHRSGAGTRRTIDDDLLSDSEDELDKDNGSCIPITHQNDSCKNRIRNVPMHVEKYIYMRCYWLKRICTFEFIM